MSVGCCDPMEHCMQFVLTHSQELIIPGGGGVLPIYSYMRYTRMCHFTGWVLEDFTLHKGLLLGFCLTKGSLFSLKTALQQGPFLVKIEVSPLKNACFADLKGKNFRKSSESYILRQFWLSFPRICLTKESNFRRWRALLKAGVWNPKMAHPRTKSGKSPPPGSLYTLSVTI